MDATEEVNLEIEGTLIPCKKKDLIANSDYFKVMFEGNFSERDKSTIKLEDVDLNAMNIILKLLWDDTYIIDNDDILLVLQVSCMLQFDKIKVICIERVTEMLCPDNCVKIWHMTESLDLKPLYLKAKNMALMEFATVKESDCLYELNITQLYQYLSNVALNNTYEFDVFTTCMKWWYENSSSETLLLGIKDETRVILYFLSCLDFKSLSDSDVKEMMTYPDVCDNTEIVELLQSVIHMRQGISSNSNMETFSKANWLLNCKSRINMSYPCVVVDNVNFCKRQKISDLYFDKFKRKRTYSIVEFRDGKSTRHPKDILLFDYKKETFTKLLSIPQEKHSELEGFHILGYKELIFFFGGEIALGRGNWNKNLWVYDTVRERWERKSRMPFGRRHFEACISGNILYIVGGTGSFRVIQDNMFYYNYKDNDWSKLITLPCVGRQVKCCDFNNQLFLLNVNSRRGYLFDLSLCNWIEMEVCDNKHLVSTYPEEFILFTYKDSLFIKGSSIIELKLVDNKLEVANCIHLKPIHCDQMESVICNNILYTLYKYTTDEQTKTISIEKFDMNSYSSEAILEYVSDEPMIELNGVRCRFTMATKIFTFQHYSLVEEDSYLTDFVI